MATKPPDKVEPLNCDGSTHNAATAHKRVNETAVQNLNLETSASEADSDLSNLLEENARQILSLGKRPRLELLGEDFFTLNFPSRLWKIVDSNIFKSAEWDESGLYILLDEQRFAKEVLRQKRIPPIFRCGGWAGFAHQLKLYSFQKVSTASSSCKVSVYYHPYFRRLCQMLLRNMKLPVVEKEEKVEGGPASGVSSEVAGNEELSQAANDLIAQIRAKVIQQKTVLLISSPPSSSSSPSSTFTPASTPTSTEASANSSPSPPPGIVAGASPQAASPHATESSNGGSHALLEKHAYPNLSPSPHLNPKPMPSASAIRAACPVSASPVVSPHQVPSYPAATTHHAPLTYADLHLTHQARAHAVSMALYNPWVAMQIAAAYSMAPQFQQWPAGYPTHQPHPHHHTQQYFQPQQQPQPQNSQQHQPQPQPQHPNQHQQHPCPRCAASSLRDSTPARVLRLVGSPHTPSTTPNTPTTLTRQSL